MSKQDFDIILINILLFLFLFLSHILKEREHIILDILIVFIFVNIYTNFQDYASSSNRNKISITYSKVLSYLVSLYFMNNF